jgi:hypothetical protein
MESSQKAPPNECGHLPVRRSSSKMGQAPGWDLRSMQAQQGLKLLGVEFLESPTLHVKAPLILSQIFP